MASNTSGAFRLWTDCFERIGEQNRALFGDFMRACDQETLNFFQRRLEQRTQMLGRAQRSASELLAAQQDFAREAAGDWADQFHRMSSLFWQTAENRMKQASSAVGSIVPFDKAEESRREESRKEEKRKAAA